MGATASVNATSKRYKTNEPIEVKFHNVVKYDDGDEKPFKDKNQLVNKRHQPLTLLSSAIRILERRPKGDPTPNYLPKQYARQVRPRSAYMVLKKGSQASSTHSTPNKQVVLSNGVHTKLSPGKKQQKTKQKLYMSLINPARLAFQDHSFPHNVMLNRTHPPTHFPMKYSQPKSNTLPRNQPNDSRRVKVNRKLYMDMIRPVMSTPQFYKLGGNRSILATPSSQRTIQSRQSHSNQTLTPRPPNENQFHKRLHPNILQMTAEQETLHRGTVPQQKETYTRRGEKTPTPQTSMRSNQSSSLGNGFLRHKEIHLPRLTTKKKDDVSLNSRTRGEIPKAHPDNIIPLYFRKSLAYSPQYKRKELLSNPL